MKNIIYLNTVNSLLILKINITKFNYYNDMSLSIIRISPIILKTQEGKSSDLRAYGLAQLAPISKLWSSLGSREVGFCYSVQPLLLIHQENGVRANARNPLFCSFFIRVQHGDTVRACSVVAFFVSHADTLVVLVRALGRSHRHWDALRMHSFFSGSPLNPRNWLYLACSERANCLAGWLQHTLLLCLQHPSD